IRLLGRAPGDARRDERRRIAREHGRAVERERLRAEKRRAGRVEDVHAHVVGVGPDRELRVVEEARAEVEGVAVVRARRVAGRRDSDALVGGYARAGELTDHPAVSELVVDDDRVSGAARLADAPEAAPEGRDANRAEERRTSRLVEDLKALVHDLDVLGAPHFAI